MSVGVGSGMQSKSQRHWTTVAQVLEQAEQLRNQGQLAQAQDLCEQVVKAQPRHAEALHLLAIVLHQAGDAATAIDMLKRAVTANPNVPLFYSNLAEMLRLLPTTEIAVIDVMGVDAGGTDHEVGAHGLSHRNALGCLRPVLARPARG